MPSHTFLAQIADLYTPLLLLLALGLCAARQIATTCRRVLYLVLSAVWVYGLMYLDNYWQIWAKCGGDYSTHTAAALALVVFCSKVLRVRWAGVALATSLLAYGELMFYMGYHSWADMFSTAVVVALGLWVTYRLLARRIGFS